MEFNPSRYQLLRITLKQILQLFLIIINYTMYYYSLCSQLDSLS